MKFNWRSLGMILVVAVLVGVSGCVTRAEVQRIVAGSNAAMVSPYIDMPGENEGDWEQAMAMMDEFIAEHPNEKIMIAHMRVRQAMLLTVNRKRNLANEYWRNAVVFTDLKTERDRVLATCGEQLSWWYEVAMDSNKIGRDEAAAAVAILDDAVRTATVGSDIRIYLSTILLQVQIRQARDEWLDDPKSELPAALEQYVKNVGADATWLEDLEGLDLTNARQMRDFRIRIWLGELMESSKRAVEDLHPEEESLEVDWRPSWVDERLQARTGSRLDVVWSLHRIGAVAA